MHIKLAIKALGRRETKLKQFLEALLARIKERRNVDLVSLLKFLYILNLEDEDEDKDEEVRPGRRVLRKRIS